MKNIVPAFMVLVLILNACSHSKSVESQKCEKIYKHSVSLINDYYTTNDKEYLNKAQQTLDSIACYQ